MRLNEAPQFTKSIGITSLIDVIFLLLLFFMLTSTFSKFSEIELIKPPQIGLAPQDRQIVFVKMKQTGIQLNGIIFQYKDFYNELKKLEEIENKNIIFSFDEEINAQQLVDVATQLQKIPKLRYTFLD